MVLSDVVLSDVDVKHSEAEVSSELAVQGFETASVTRFHRTARGKPPKALPLVRVSLEEEAASRLLAAGGVHLFRVCCAAGRPKSDRDSASAKGWSADSNQHRGRKVEQAAPRTAAAAVAPLQGVPYAEQLQRKRDAMRAELAQLPALLWQEAAHVGAAQLPAWHSLGWLRAEALERHGGAPCEVEAVVASPLQEAYRNKCEFSIGADANGLPCVGFVVGTQAGVHMVCEPSDCRNVTLEMRAAAARVQAAVRASTLPPYDRKSNKGFWLQLAARQAFNCGAPPALLLVLTIKVEGWAEAELKTELRRMRAALCEPPLQPPAPPRPPAAPTAIGDSKFGCGYPGPHLTEPMTGEALTAAVDNASVTCIKLAPITYSLTSTLLVGQDDSTVALNNGIPAPQHPRGSAPLAILAEEGPATLDGGGSVQLISSKSGADVSLANLVLRNGYADWDVRLCHLACVSCRFHGLRTAFRLAAAAEHVHRVLAPCTAWRRHQQ